LEQSWAGRPGKSIVAALRSGGITNNTTPVTGTALVKIELLSSGPSRATPEGKITRGRITRTIQISNDRRISPTEAKYRPTPTGKAQSFGFAVPPGVLKDPTCARSRFSAIDAYFAPTKEIQ
jgi:hypothetical protein